MLPALLYAFYVYTIKYQESNKVVSVIVSMHLFVVLLVSKYL